MNSLRQMARTKLAITTLAMLSMLGVSCSLVLNADDECDGDDDCASQGANLRCRKHLCVATGDVDGDTDTNTDMDAGLDTNPDAGDNDLDGGGDTDRPPLTGMDLLGGPCNRLDGMDDPTQEIPEDAIVIGSILPLTGELSVAGNYFDHVTILANEEINRTGGVQGRDLLKVSCDSASSPVQAKAAAEHLRDLGVQAVLGPFASELVMYVYSDVLSDAGMMVVTAGANAPIMATVSAEGLIWSTSLPAAREARATAEHLLHSSWTKVAVIHRDDTWGDSMFNAFYKVYCSGPGIDCSNTDQFLVRAYDTGDLATSVSSVVTELRTWGPDITVAFAYIDDGLTFLTTVGMTDGMGYPLNSLLWNSAVASELTFDLLNPAYFNTLCQLQGTVQQMPQGLVYSSFLTRYRSRWSGENPVPYTAAFYDAAYMLAYAYAAASSAENPYPKGVEIADAMNRLSSGVSVNAGAEDWNVGVMALRSSKDATIDYVGASGDVDFQGGTGSIICPVEAFRLNVTDKKVESVGVIFSKNDQYTAPDFSEVADTECGSNIQP